MYARLTTTVLSSEQRDASAEVLEQVMPTLRQLDGFKGIIVVSEGDGKRVVAMSLWETADALEASAPVLDQIRDAETAGRNVESQDSVAFRVFGFDVRWLVTQALAW